MKKLNCLAAFALFILLAVPCTSSALTLPDPYGVYDGLPVAIQYDQFFSYSIYLMDALEQEGYLPLPEGSDSYLYTGAGVGAEDIVLYTQSGVSNENIGPSDDMTFEEPTESATGSTTSFAGWWGQDDQNNDGISDTDNGPVTVGQILTYLQAFDPANNTPVFIFDLNQQGANPNLFAWGQVTLLDPDTRKIVEYWAFDNFTDGLFGAEPVFVPGELNLTGASGTEYDLSFNTGSGSADYFLYSPWMNLSLFDSDLLFVTEFYFDGLNNGGEELMLSGVVTPGYVIPEPSTIILLGMGFLGLIGLRLRRKH